MTTTRATLRALVSDIAHRTNRHPLVVLAVFADKLPPHQRREVEAEIDACLDGRAYREF